MKKLRSATDSIKELLAWFLLALALANLGYSLAEHVSPSDAFWWSWVTGTTTGYGDMYPHTVPGRVITMLWMAFMFVWACVFTARLASHMIVNNDAFTHNEQEAIKDGVREIREMLTEGKSA